MRLDELARAAAEDLRESADRDLDPAVSLGRLRRTRRRRKAAWLTAVAAVVVATAVAASDALGGRRAVLPLVPAEPTRTAASARTTAPPRPDEAFVVRSGTGLLSWSSRGLETLHGIEAEVRSFAFSPDGSRVAYGTPTSIVVADPDTGRSERLAACRTDACPVTWTPDGLEVLTSSPGLLRRIEVSTGVERTVALPAGWDPLSLDVSREGLVLMVVGGPDTGRLATVPLSGGMPAVVHTLPRATFGFDARWSPDGRRVAWMSKAEPDLPSVSVSDLVVNVVDADGGHARRLAVVGRCACLGHTPGLDWSPRGRLAVMSSDTRTQTAFEVGPAGKLTRIGGGSGPVAWRPATPG
ncbi:WD40-like Beta Propeller Repeat [Pedococcus cremeus]|uniref:WD40-like Beta Propeller Repeat n=1 Tax=Pedococcus cremeus TaxID=587636 RepID=A0A1H9XT39_9MICO|nr:WD40 repeat domain-containing protein [Pedococcus cremeus]SES48853.1 WD40-like Beta Propeller Repeat [Pedococcus cremeus]